MESNEQKSELDLFLELAMPQLLKAVEERKKKRERVLTMEIATKIFQELEKEER